MKNKISSLILFLTSRNAFYAILVSYLLLNLLYIFFGQLPFTSDSLYYFQKASECVVNGTFYPASHNINDQYIQSPLYINILVVLLNIHHSQFIILIANVILNFVQLVLIYLIALGIFNEERSARIASLVYIFYITNLGAVLQNYSEFLFVTLILLSFYLFLKNKIITLLISGFLLGIAIDIKQLAIVLLTSFVVTLFYTYRKNDSIKIGSLLSGFAIAVLLIGFVTKIGFNEFIITPETASVNMLMGANDDSNGSFNADVFQKGKVGYIENEDNLTHQQKTEFYREQAFNWITENPFRWISLFPVKLIHLYAFDDWSIFTLANTTEWNLPKIAKYLFKNLSDEKLFQGESTAFIIIFTLLYIYHYLFYFVFLFLVVFQFLKIIRNRKDSLLTKLLPIYLFVILGTCSILLGVGAARYKYPFIILLIFSIVPLFKNIIQNQKEKSIPNYNL